MDEKIDISTQYSAVYAKKTQLKKIYATYVATYHMLSTRFDTKIDQVYDDRRSFTT